MENYIRHILKPFNLTLWKVDIVFIMASIVTAISTFAPNYLGVSGGFLLVLFILLLSDFITGYAAAVFNGEKRTSRKGLKTVYKTGAYMLFIYVSFNLYKEVEGRAALFETVIQYFHIYIIVHVSFWELFSIDENLKKLNMDLGITSILHNAYTIIKNIFSNIGKNKGKDETPEDQDLID